MISCGDDCVDCCKEHNTTNRIFRKKILDDPSPLKMSFMGPHGTLSMPFFNMTVFFWLGVPWGLNLKGILDEYETFLDL